MKRIRSDRIERPGSSRGIWIVRLAVVVIVINVAYWAWRLGSPASLPESVPAYGEAMPQWRANAVSEPSSAGQASFAGHFGLLLYADRAPSTSFIRYLQVLLDRYGDHGAGLRVALAVAPEHVKREAVKETVGDVGYPAIHDSSGALRRILRLRPHQEHTFLVGPDGQLVLSAPGLVDRDELRQHLEKHMLGEIQYAASPVSLLGPEARLPAYDVFEVTSGAKAVAHPYSPLSGTTVLVLPAELCASCGDAELSGRIAALHRKRCAGTADDCQVELLATAGYSVEELLSSFRSTGLDGLRAFQARGSLAGLEDDYFTKRQRGKTDALVLRMGPNRKVVAVSTLEEEMEANHAE